MFHTKYDEKAKIWSGPNIPALYNPNISIGHILLRCLKLYGSKVAQISDDSGIQLTFKELYVMTIRAAQNLQKRGYKPKQIVGIMADNTEYLSPIVFASFCMGCPMNTLKTSVPKDDVIRMFKITEPSVLFCDVKVYDLVKECLNELKNDAKIFTFNGTRGNSEPVESLFEATGNEADFIPVDVDGMNETAAILCSSGTTGPFKGVCLSHVNLTSHIMLLLDLCTSDDILLQTSSLQWVSGYWLLLLGTICGATRIITTEGISSVVHLRLIENYRITFVSNYVSDMISLLKSGLLTKSNLSSIKRFIVGGANVPSTTLEQFKSFVVNGSVNIMYGMTEMGGVSIEINGVHSVGQIAMGNKVKIIDEKGNRCGVNTDGEICIKRPYVFHGYYGSHELSQTVIDDEGFFVSGDIGHFDDDGNLHIVDRKKDLILYHEFVSPSDIEGVLINSPDIEDICVVGVRDNMCVELPAAVVVRKITSKITQEDICKVVDDNLLEYNKLRGGVYFVDSIPKTPSGKLLRRWAKETANKLYNARQQQMLLSV